MISRFGRILRKMLCWLISIAFHSILILIVLMMSPSSRTDDRERIIRVTFVQKELEKDLVEQDRSLEDDKETAPVVTEEEPEDHLETEDDEIIETAKGAHMDGGGAGQVTAIAVPGRQGTLAEYGFRSRGGREKAVTKFGGGASTESAVEAGLKWLSLHQSSDGAWYPNLSRSSTAYSGRGMIGGVLWTDNDGDGNFKKVKEKHVDASALKRWAAQCPPGNSCVGVGGRKGGVGLDSGTDAPTAVTGLALLAFLGAGYTHEAGGYSDTVKKGLDYLVWIQKSDGRLTSGSRRRRWMYSHGIAAFALSEAYWMTKSADLRDPAQRAIDYICKVQNRMGGWDYKSPSRRNDMSVSGWQFMALRSARMAGLHVPKQTIDRLVEFLKIATDQETGSVCYTIYDMGSGKEPKRERGSLTMRSVGMLGHLFYKVADPEHPMMLESGNTFLNHLPCWQVADLYYWYNTTLVSFQIGGKHWEKWNKAMKQALLENQISGETHADGSWPPVDKYSSYWSRPGITALCILCLETYYRYPPLKVPSH